jgi:hypothetical protein
VTGADKGPERAPDAHPPILLTEIDRALAESSAVERANEAAQIRAWRTDLSAALESLTYAGYVLATDVGILRNSIAEASQDTQALVDNLPALLAATGFQGWTVPPDLPLEATSCAPALGRAEDLMSSHQEMARTDLGSPDDVARALQELEQQLEGITQRRDAVEKRLREVRAAIVQQYKDGTLTPDDWLT